MIKNVTGRPIPKSVFIGTRLEALLALERYTDLESIITKKNSWVDQKYGSEKMPVKYVNKTNKFEIFEFLLHHQTDIVFSAGFPFILPNHVLTNGTIFINSHPSLLPLYKGYNAIKDALRCKEEYLGVTVHYMVEDVDCGDIICQDKVWVKDMMIQEIYGLIFGVVEPMVITKALGIVLQKHF